MMAVVSKTRTAAEGVELVYYNPADSDHDRMAGYMVAVGHTVVADSFVDSWVAVRE